MIHQGDDHSLPSRVTCNPPPFRSSWASSFATLLVPFQNNGNPRLEKEGCRSHHLYHFLHRGIVCWIDPLGHGFDKVGVALTKIRGILLFGIERMLFDREIFPFPVLRNRPSELTEPRAGFGLRSGGKKSSQLKFLN